MTAAVVVVVAIFILFVSITAVAIRITATRGGTATAHGGAATPSEEQTCRGGGCRCTPTHTAAIATDFHPLFK